MAVRSPPRNVIESVLRSLNTPLRFGSSLLTDQVSVEQIEAELLAETRVRGKFTKLEAVYLPFTPVPPLAFFYECSTCRLYQPGKDRSAGGCQVVEGEILPYAWSALWLPNRQDRPLGWLAGPLADWQSLFVQREES